MEPSTNPRPRPGFVRRYWLTFLVSALALGATCMDVVIQVGMAARDLIFSIKEGHLQFQCESVEAVEAWAFEHRDFRWVEPSIGDLPTFFASDSSLEISVPIWLILVLAADWLILREYLRMKPARIVQRSPLELKGALLNAQVRRADEQE